MLLMRELETLLHFLVIEGFHLLFYFMISYQCFNFITLASWLNNLDLSHYFNFQK